jgi:hypothetical protein
MKCNNCGCVHFVFFRRIKLLCTIFVNLKEVCSSIVVICHRFISSKYIFILVVQHLLACRTNGVDSTFDCVRIMIYPFDYNIGFGTLLGIYRRIRQVLEPLFPPIIPVPQCLSRYTVGHLLSIYLINVFSKDLCT